MTVKLLNKLDDLVERKRWKTISIYVGFLLVFSSGLSGGVGRTVSWISSISSTNNPMGSNKTEELLQSAGERKQGMSSGEMLLDSGEKGSVAGVSTSLSADPVFNELDWDLNTSVVKQKEIGSYCVRERKSFEGGEIWYRKKLRIGEAVKIRFSLRSDENVKDAVQLPKLVLLYGRREDNSPSYRMFFPDVDTGFIGFESISSGKKQTQSSHLLRPLDYSSVQEIELEYSVESLHSNDALFQYKLAYVPTSDDGKQVTDEGSFQSSFPWPNAKNTEQEFGLGAFTGTCFHIISFEKGFQQKL